MHIGLCHIIGSGCSPFPPSQPCQSNETQCEMYVSSTPSSSTSKSSLSSTHLPAPTKVLTHQPNTSHSISKIKDLDKTSKTTKNLPAKSTEQPTSLEQDFQEGGLWISAPIRTVLRQTLNKINHSSTTPFRVIHYGDSHSKVNWFSKAMAYALQPTHTQANALHTQANTFLMPGFVHVGHPRFWSGKVTSHGYWLRQNWLYSTDHAPFGPLGISMVTQEQSAHLDLHLTLATYHTQPDQVKDLHDIKKLPRLTVDVYYATGEQRLPFCAIVHKDLSSLKEYIEDREENHGKLLMDHFQTLPTAYMKKCQVRDAQESSGMAHLSLQVPFGYKVLVQPQDGSMTEQRLINQRSKARKRMHRLKRRARQRKKKYKVKLPKYAQYPHVIKPQLNYLKIFGFRVWETKQETHLAKEVKSTAQNEMAVNQKIKSSHHKINQIEWNTLAVNGTRIYSPAKLGGPEMEQYLADVQADLLVFWYGSNSVAQKYVNLNRYKQQYHELITRLKHAHTQAACIVIGPPDFGRRDRDCFLNKNERRLIRRKRKSQKVLKLLAKNREKRICDPENLINPRKKGRYRYLVPKIRNEKQWQNYLDQCRFHLPTQFEELIAIQKEVALAQGCIYFDLFEAMGKQGSIQKWACAEERWAQYDLIHLKAKGYQAIAHYLAHLLKKAVAMEYDEQALILTPIIDAVEQDTTKNISIVKHKNE